MNGGTARHVIRRYAPWIIANVGIYVLAYMERFALVRVTAFVALFLSTLFFALGYRVIHSGKRDPGKIGFRIVAGATILAGFLYLIFSGWRP